MAFTPPSKYLPQFQHQDWIDNLDRVQAAGENGFNRRFHGLEDEFAHIKTVLDNLATVAVELQNAVGNLQTLLGGALSVQSITVQNAAGIGTQTPGAPLHVADHAVVGPFPFHLGSAVGRFEVSGPAAELAFVRRTLGSAPATPAAGDRFVWYNPDGSARLWTEIRGDLVYVDSSGKVGIGTTSPNYILDVAGRMRVRTQGGAFTAGIWFSGYGNTDRAFVGMQAEKLVGFWGNTGNPGWRLNVNTDNGDLNITGNAFKPGGGAWGAASDIRLKKNIEPLRGALDKLLRLRGVLYEWKEPQKQGNLTGMQVGLIAQEVEDVFPDWVGKDSEGYKTLTVRGFEALTIEALRELKVENEALKAKYGELDAEVKALGTEPKTAR